MATRTLIIGAVVVVVVLVAAGLAFTVYWPGGGDGGPTGQTYVVHSSDYVNYTLSLSNGSITGYWRCSVVEVIPEAESITWNITQMFPSIHNS